MNIEHLCKGCMRQLDTPGGICPKCGYDNGKSENRSIKCLPEYAILNGRYMIGRVLGEGGFGITYLALDLTSEKPVAVKEYFPAGLAARDSAAGAGETLIMLDGERERYYQDGLQKFALEGRNLARLSRQPGIVTALDFFEANGTAYLVMEYIEGQSLKEYMRWYQQNSDNKPIDYPVAIAFLEPVMKSLIEVHRAGLVHRDISPDNILVDKNGKVTLIDFGAARVGVKENELRSMTIMVKHGYAPEEQYRTHGKQGPWTDVYALCATLYHMISGELPVDSIERMRKDELIPLKDLKLPVPVPAAVSDILEKGMKVWPEERYQTMEELYHDLKKVQEELDAREKEQERERLEQARLEAERLEREHLAKMQLTQEQLTGAQLGQEQLEEAQSEQEHPDGDQTQSGNITIGNPSANAFVTGSEGMTGSCRGPQPQNDQKLAEVHQVLERLRQQEEALKEQERLRMEERKKLDELLKKEEARKKSQRRTIYTIAAVTAVAVLAVGIGVYRMNSGNHGEQLPATAQVQATETESQTENVAGAKAVTETETEAETETENETEIETENETETETENETETELEPETELPLAPFALSSDEVAELNKQLQQQDNQAAMETLSQSAIDLGGMTPQELYETTSGYFYGEWPTSWSKNTEEQTESAPDISDKVPFWQEGKAAYLYPDGTVEEAPDGEFSSGYENYQMVVETDEEGNLTTNFGEVDFLSTTFLKSGYSSSDVLKQEFPRFETYSGEGMYRYLWKEKIGYLDQNGELAIPLQFTYASSFSQGRALVSVPASDSEHAGQLLYGYINTEGLLVTPLFTTGSDYKNDVAQVTFSQGSTSYLGVIDLDGALMYAWDLSELLQSLEDSETGNSISLGSGNVGLPAPDGTICVGTNVRSWDEDEKQADVSGGYYLLDAEGHIVKTFDSNYRISSQMVRW